MADRKVIQSATPSFSQQIKCTLIMFLGVIPMIHKVPTTPPCSNTHFSNTFKPYLQQKLSILFRFDCGKSTQKITFTQVFNNLNLKTIMVAREKATSKTFTPLVIFKMHYLHRILLIFANSSIS